MTTKTSLYMGMLSLLLPSGVWAQANVIGKAQPGPAIRGAAGAGIQANRLSPVSPSVNLNGVSLGVNTPVVLNQPIVGVVDLPAAVPAARAPQGDNNKVTAKSAAKNQAQAAEAAAAAGSESQAMPVLEEVSGKLTGADQAGQAKVLDAAYSGKFGAADQAVLPSVTQKPGIGSPGAVWEDYPAEARGMLESQGKFDAETPKDKAFRFSRELAAARGGPNARGLVKRLAALVGKNKDLDTMIVIRLLSEMYQPWSNPSGGWPKKTAYANFLLKTMGEIGPKTHFLAQKIVVKGIMDSMFQQVPSGAYTRAALDVVEQIAIKYSGKGIYRDIIPGLAIRVMKDWRLEKIKLLTSADLSNAKEERALVRLLQKHIDNIYRSAGRKIRVPRNADL